jgi:hypothetical protein
MHSPPFSLLRAPGLRESTDVEKLDRRRRASVDQLRHHVTDFEADCLAFGFGQRMKRLGIAPPI